MESSHPVRHHGWFLVALHRHHRHVDYRNVSADPGQPPTERGRSRGFADIWNATDVGDAHYRGCRHISIVFFVADHTGVAGARLDIGRNLCRGDGGARYLSFLPVPWP